MVKDIMTLFYWQLYWGSRRVPWYKNGEKDSCKYVFGKILTVFTFRGAMKEYLDERAT
jgi:hypothetical protein